MTGAVSPRLALVAAVLVLVGGVITAAVHDAGGSNSNRTSTTTATSSTVANSPTSGSGTTTTTTSAPVSTTVRTAVPSPEAATNGLWAAYAANNTVAAKRFATDEVISTLFEQPFNGEAGTFQGCTPVGDGTFDCEYLQPSTRYKMTAKAGDDGSFEIVRIEVVSIS